MLSTHQAAVLHAVLELDRPLRNLVAEAAPTFIRDPRFDHRVALVTIDNLLASKCLEPREDDPRMLEVTLRARKALQEFGESLHQLVTASLRR